MPLKKSLQQASELLRAGAPGPALDLLVKLEAERPEEPDVLRLLGIVLSRLGRDEEAEPRLRKVAALLPESRDAMSDHANVLLNLGRADEALSRLLPFAPDAVQGTSRATASDAANATFNFNLGRAFKASGDPGSSLAPLRACLRAQPQHYGALVSLGDAYKALGHLEESARSFRDAIAAQPGEATAWWSLANLKSGRFTDAEFEQLQKLARKGSSTEQQIYWEFALAQAFDERDRKVDAFACYQSGNRLKRTVEPWNRKEFRAWLQRLHAGMANTFPPGRPAAWRKPRPVFLVSLPRSGSTLTEQILSAHSAVSAAGELPWVPRLIASESNRRRRGLDAWASLLSPGDWAAMGEAYRAHTQPWQQGKAVFTDKLPGNFPYVGAILAMLPDALVVNVQRSAPDVCWSCYRQLFVSGAGFAYDLRDLAAYWHDHRRFMGEWQQRAPGRVLNVQYESLVREPESVIRELLAFLDLPFEKACLRSHESQRVVSTPSAAQVRQAINAGGIEHWRRYEPFLGELLDALADEESGSAKAW